MHGEMVQAPEDLIQPAPGAGISRALNQEAAGFVTGSRQSVQEAIGILLRQHQKGQSTHERGVHGSRWGCLQGLQGASERIDAGCFSEGLGDQGQQSVPRHPLAPFRGEQRGSSLEQGPQDPLLNLRQRGPFLQAVQQQADGVLQAGLSQIPFHCGEGQPEQFLQRCNGRHALREQGRIQQAQNQLEQQCRSARDGLGAGRHRGTVLGEGLGQGPGTADVAHEGPVVAEADPLLQHGSLGRITAQGLADTGGRVHGGSGLEGQLHLQTLPLAAGPGRGWIQPFGLLKTGKGEAEIAQLGCRPALFPPALGKAGLQPAAAAEGFQRRRPELRLGMAATQQVMAMGEIWAEPHGTAQQGERLPPGRFLGEGLAEQIGEVGLLKGSGLHPRQQEPALLDQPIVGSCLIERGEPGTKAGQIHAARLGDGPSVAQCGERIPGAMDRNSAEVANPGTRSSALGRQLVLWLLERQWTPQRLRTGVENPDELEQLCLEEVIQLRDQGEPQLSLGLIAIAQGLGLRSPWFDDNRARALLLVGEEESARGIWQALAGHPDPAVAAVAEGMAEFNANEEPSPEEPPEELPQDLPAGVALIELLETSGHGAQRLREAGQGPEELERACLEEAILLREEGNPRLSLELITAAQELGLASPWLSDNQARALVALDRRQEAFSIWQALSTAADEACAAMAADMVTLLRNSLLEPLQEECGRRSWLPLHLQASEAETAAPLECALREVIASREGGQAELSLALVERCLQLGWSSPWLRDNQARALVHLDRIEEAVGLWRDLATLEADPTLRVLAEEMLQLYGPTVARAACCREVESLLAEGNNHEAETRLIEALLQDPDAEELRQMLERVIEEQGDVDESTLLGRELRDPTLRLEVHRRLLEALEQELGAAPLNPA